MQDDYCLFVFTLSFKYVVWYKQMLLSRFEICLRLCGKLEGENVWKILKILRIPHLHRASKLVMNPSLTSIEFHYLPLK